MSEAAIQHLTKADKKLARVIRRVGPCTLRTRKGRSPFESLAQSIVYQQLAGRAAETILGRVKALFPGKRFPNPEEILQTTDERFRQAGLSRNKTAAMKDLAAKTIEGVVPGHAALARLSDGEIIERLTVVRGIGPWTVEMLLIKLGRPDVLSATDYGLRKGFALTYGWEELPTPTELLEHGECWRPHRTVASWYLWRAVDLLEK